MTPQTSSSTLSERLIPSWHAWRAAAACKDLDTELFFPNGEGEGLQSQVEQARRVCTSCPVRDECLDFALTTRQEDGVWGGLTEEERRRWRRRMQRDRRAAS